MSDHDDEGHTFLADCEYMRDFFVREERLGADGRSYSRPYVDDEGHPFLPSLVGYVRDILPAGPGRQASSHSPFQVQMLMNA
jgi:hypothetical protein